MTNASLNLRRIGLAVAAAVGLLTVNDVAPTTSGYFVTKANALIGRPATPMSYAGVARRTTRREAYGVGAYGGYRGYGYGAGAIGAAAVGAAAYGAATYGAGNCVQVTDVYGRLVTQCY
jgi:hypothetical protein